MNKPFSLIKRDFTTKIYDVIRDSRLDLGVVDLIFKQISQEIGAMADKQANEDYDNWQRYLAEMAKANEKPDGEKKDIPDEIKEELKNGPDHPCNGPTAIVLDDPPQE